MGIEIRYYETETGKQPYKDWFNGLKNGETIARIDRRLDRVEEGNFGDHKHIEGEIYELRFKFGSGPRIYYGIEGNQIIILLCGGDKGSQKRDIKKAKEYWEDYCSRR